MRQVVWRLAQEGEEGAGEGAGEAPVDACGPVEEAGYVCRRVFEWTENEFLAKAADWLVARPTTILLILAVAWLLNRFARRAIRRFVAQAKDENWQQRVAELRRRSGVSLLDTGPTVSERRAQRADAIGAVMRSVTAVVIYGIAALMALAELGINLGPLIAGAGIVGVALGFGAQSLVRDFLAGIFMLVEDQYGAGDFIDVQGVIGEVEGISLRATKVRDLYGTLWHIPNGEILKVGNMSQQWARAVIDVEVAYGTDVEHAIEVVQAVATEMWEEPDYHRTVILEQPEVWGVQTLGASGVAIRLVTKVKPLTQWSTERQLRRRLKARFDEVGIEIPFPQRAVWLRGQDGGSEAPVDPSDPAIGAPPGDVEGSPPTPGARPLAEDGGDAGDGGNGE